MTRPLMCCGTPPLIFSAKNATGDRIITIHSVACLTCGRSEEHTDQNQAIQKFNRRKKEEHVKF